ncbi:class I SAM-dependent methyltransferase [Nocardioides sp. LS1]|uniref:class I SAM-dependent methyltransferase n=1 Tax=Nocardioides sp. LS1 TaxID=1027620 RepID=UPI000F61EFFA|nr:class I SAM-dependent methyltransferase [Nocardioides sp. LS1]GCD88984.1 SAM-dependent methyltransferase [Nocardioides sp. LS1]
MTFDVAAESYERFMGAWSTGLAPQLIAYAGVRPGQTVLDVGCGPGILTRPLVDLLGADHVVAVDPSPSFVAATADRFPGVRVAEAGAESLPLDDGEVDHALAQLVVHFMTDPVAGLAEMARVTRPGGVVAASVWDHGGGRGPLSTFFEAVQSLDPDNPGERDYAGVNAGHLGELLRAAGLGRVEETRHDVERHYDDVDAWWAPYTLGVGPAGAYVAGLDDDGKEALLEACRARLPRGPFTATASAWVARGTVR